MVWGAAHPLPDEALGGAILVADDDGDVRAMVRTLLELDGLEVLEASDGAAAWSLIQQRAPAVVVADVRMARMDGLQLCRKVRESKRPCKVIVYTAGMASEDEARKAGCDRYFLKTEPLPRLRDAIRQFLAGSAP